MLVNEIDPYIADKFQHFLEITERNEAVAASLVLASEVTALRLYTAAIRDQVEKLTKTKS